MKKINAYECDFCGKYLKTKKSIVEHEPICFKNPESKSCITCSKFNVHFDEVEQEEKRICKSGEILRYSLKTDCVYHRKNDNNG